ncbi:hypothetical protein Leryth_011249 [Lithospermum erythrorhizon]|nr:hypothetical protein Leryth_011249 [Lithospermum erythrorhizon]
MSNMKDTSDSVYTWLLEHAGPKKQWVRAYFSLNVYNDALCNNNSESFNSFILEARDKPIITMLEMIRTKLMERIRDRYLAMSKKDGPLCVKIKKILDCRMAESVGFVAMWNGKFGFEVKTGGDDAAQGRVLQLWSMTIKWYTMFAFHSMSCSDIKSVIH